MKLELDKVYASLSKNHKIDVITLLSFGNIAGYSIPHFCYHRKLMLAGSCRACLCLVEKERKASPACATHARNNMHLLLGEKYTAMQELRENVLELILCNHPLDCPVCDQGGECELQDISHMFGNATSGFFYRKHCFENKNCGPVIKTVMNRCIHCTRCVRFAKDIAGFELWGLTGRGSSMEIGNYINSFFYSEVSGNIADLCPVGALTIKPYSFKSRPWDLVHDFFIDLSDGLGSNISINSRGSFVYRIIPRTNDEVNEDWISDKARFYFDGLLHNRITSPMNSLKAINWDFAYFLLKKNLFNSNFDGNEFRVFMNNNIECESMIIIKKFFNKLGISTFDNPIKVNNGFGNNYKFNKFTDIDDKLHVCLTVGCNLKDEASVLNLRYRKKYINGHSYFYNIGTFCNLNYAVYNLSSNMKAFVNFVEGKNSLTTVFTRKNNIFNHVIFNSSFFMSRGYYNSFDFFRTFLKQIKSESIVNILYSKPNTIGNLDINFYHRLPINPKKIKNLFLINTDNSYTLSVDHFNNNFLKNKFIVFIGSIATDLVKYANIILPDMYLFQRAGTFINIEGRPQFVLPIYKVFGKNRHDFDIFLSLGISLNLKLNLDGRDLPKLIERYLPHCLIRNKVQTHAFTSMAPSVRPFGVLYNVNFVPKIYSFYQSDDISANSLIMSDIRHVYNKSIKNREIKNFYYFY